MAKIKDLTRIRVICEEILGYNSTLSNKVINFLKNIKIKHWAVSLNATKKGLSKRLVITGVSKQKLDKKYVLIFRPKTLYVADITIYLDKLKFSNLLTLLTNFNLEPTLNINLYPLIRKFLKGKVDIDTFTRRFTLVSVMGNTN